MNKLNIMEGFFGKPQTSNSPVISDKQLAGERDVYHVGHITLSAEYPLKITGVIQDVRVGPYQDDPDWQQCVYVDKDIYSDNLEYNDLFNAYSHDISEIGILDPVMTSIDLYTRKLILYWNAQLVEQWEDVFISPKAYCTPWRTIKYCDIQKTKINGHSAPIETGNGKALLGIPKNELQVLPDNAYIAINTWLHNYFGMLINQHSVILELLKYNVASII